MSSRRSQRRPAPVLGGFPERLGRLTWRDLHVYARHDPRPDVDLVLRVLMEHYPCEVCRSHLCETLGARVGGETDPVLRLFELHNRINRQLGKALFPAGDLEETYGPQGAFYAEHLQGMTYEKWVRRLEGNALRAR